jgi:seryl-tRNA synthetase
MHDIKLIREQAKAIENDPNILFHPFDWEMKRRGLPQEAQTILGLDEHRRNTISILETEQSKLNDVSKRIGIAKRAGEDTSKLESEAKLFSWSVANAKEALPKAESRLNDLLHGLPNILDDDVPDGRDEAENVEQKQFGARRNFGFTPKQHFELGEALGLMDFADAAKLAGSRFTVLKGALARLERALGQFMIDIHTTEHGYSEISVPLLVNEQAMFGTGQLPKFKEDLFETTDGRWLIPTAEVSLTNLVANDITPGWQLPIRLTALTPCFRSEAGSAGRDVRGMLRQHQFTKVEMVSITHPDASGEEHERMTRCAETILERLELPYRRMLLCAGDTGFSAAKTFDLEVWLPGQNQYREISSCSNTRAFQARRMNARFREKDGKTLGFVHTLNGSGVAVGRALIAVMENYQNEDGSIDIPEVLQPYMGHITKISAA